MSQFEYDEPVVVEPGEAIKFKSDPEGIKKLFEEVYKVVSKSSSDKVKEQEEDI